MELQEKPEIIGNNQQRTFTINEQRLMAIQRQHDKRDQKAQR